MITRFCKTDLSYFKICISFVKKISRYRSRKFHPGVILTPLHFITLIYSRTCNETFRKILEHRKAIFTYFFTTVPLRTFDFVITNSFLWFYINFQPVSISIIRLRYATSFQKERHMHTGQIVFSQILQHLPVRRFRTCVSRYNGNRRVRNFTCYDQFLAMAFAQLAFRESRTNCTYTTSGGKGTSFSRQPVNENIRIKPRIFMTIFLREPKLITSDARMGWACFMSRPCSKNSAEPKNM